MSEGGGGCLWMSKSGGVFQFSRGWMTSRGQCPRGWGGGACEWNVFNPPPPFRKSCRPIRACILLSPRCYLFTYWEFGQQSKSQVEQIGHAKITQTDAFNYMSYHFLCKRGIRPARTEQFLVVFLPCSVCAGPARWLVTQVLRAEVLF